MDVDELMEIRKMLGNLLGKEEVKKSDTDKSTIHKVVRKNRSLNYNIDCIKH
jgi:hypothetical protein